MTTARPGARGTPRAHLPLWGVTSVVITSLLLLLPVASAAPTAGSSVAYTPTAWDNSAVLCRFDPSGPSVTATGVGTAAAGMWIGMDGTIVEESALGVLGASASLQEATWAAANLSTDEQYALEYHALVPVDVVVAGVLGLPLGNANVTVAFGLPESAVGPLGTGDTVTVSMAISDWPWQPLFPDLVANLSVSPANASAEHLALDTTGGTTVESVSNVTGKVAASLTAPAEANVTSSGGVLSLAPIVSAVVSVSTELAALSLSFGAPASGAKSVGFSAPMVVVPAAGYITIPGTSVHLPLIDFAAAIGAAVVASLAIAGATRRVRHAPSDLEYVEEEA